ncbi:putative F-box domain-containing protein, partial [Tanacetum coccineum]
MRHRHIPDDILVNILARLPGKPLLRCRCVSILWNRLISDPYFMKSRSRRMILFPFPRPLVVIDDNVPVDDKAHSMVRIRSPLEHQEGVEVSVVGTFNGIVLLVLIDVSLSSSRMILYNPLTCASKLILELDPPTLEYEPYVFGFGYGATPNDLKVIRIGAFDMPNDRRFTCDVFDLKTSSWARSRYLALDFYFWGNVGTFLHGVLYWVVALL